MNVIICGLCGKMGRCLVKLISSSENSKVVAGIDKFPCNEFDFPVFTSLEEANVKADVIIEFSHPSALSQILSYCEKTKTPAVICTTGFSQEEVKEIKKASEKTAIFYSRNMSLGINLILTLAKKAASFLGNGFDIEITEKHHNQKIDAPSGTALMIAEEIKRVKTDGELIFDRTKRREKRKPSEIGMHCVRGGSICGDHEVMFAGENEIITISHHAQSREVFASGAIKAAEFMVGKSAGLYSMEDMLLAK